MPPNLFLSLVTISLTYAISLGVFQKYVYLTFDDDFKFLVENNGAIVSSYLITYMEEKF